MPYERPSLGQLAYWVIGDISSRNEGRAYIKRAAETIFGYVIAGVAHPLYGKVELLFKQILPIEADLPNLLRWGEIAKEPRKGGTRAAGGTLTVSGEIGAVVEAGTHWLAPSGAIIVNLQTHTLADVTAELAAAALEAGAAGNVEGGTELTIVTPIDRLDTTAMVGASISGGTDLEDVEVYRPRVIDNVRRTPRAGGPGDYRGWMLQVEGVTRVWERPKRGGVGVVSLAFVMDERDDIIPTEDDVDAVYAYIAARAPLDLRAVHVVAPKPRPVDITLSLVPPTPAVRDAALDQLAALFRREADFEQPLARSVVDEAISEAEGEASHEITAIGSLTPGPWEILTLGTVTTGIED